jgi:polyhydroxybutyrate depolymerase
LYIPSTVRSIFVGLHGRGGSGKEFLFKTEFFKKAEQENILLILPDGLNKSWVDGRNLESDDQKLDDVKFIITLAEKYKKFYKIDSAYLFGYSNGGFMTQKIAFTKPESFKAYANIVSTISFNLSKSKPLKPTSVLFIMGKKDPIVPFEGGEVFGKKGMILSADDSIKIWEKQNQCKSSKESLLKKEEETAVIKDYNHCIRNVKIKYIVLNQAGHGWPGKIEEENQSFGLFTDIINANEEITSFFLNNH